MSKEMREQIKKFNDLVIEQVINGYETIAETPKYGLVKVHNTYRVENYKGKERKKIPYIEIPKDLANEFTDYLIDYKDLGMTKTEGKSEFNKYCDNMFAEEGVELSQNEND
jgi:hypothetical protein